MAHNDQQVSWLNSFSGWWFDSHVLCFLLIKDGWLIDIFFSGIETANQPG